MPQQAQTIKLLDSYPVTAVNTFDTTREMVQEALELEVGQRPITDLDIQRALRNQHWGRAIALDYFANVIISMTVERRKVLTLIRYFKEHNLELQYERAREYADDLRRHHHYSPPVEDEEASKAKTLIHRLQRDVSRLTLTLTGLNATTYLLRKDLHQEQRRYRQLQLAYAELSRDTTKELKALTLTRNVVLANLVSDLGLVVNEDHHPHLFDFHTAEPHIQEQFITTLQDTEVYPHNAHLTAEDIRNLLFHAEITKWLQKCQAGRQGYELRLEQKIDELYGCKMKCHALENQLTSHLGKVRDVEMQLYKKNIELDVHHRQQIRADDPNPAMNQDIAASMF